MEKNNYLNLLNERFKRHFQVKSNQLIIGENIDIYARYSETTGRTFITQKDIIDKFEVNEYCFIKTLEGANLDTLQSFTEFLKLLTVDFVKPHKEHRSTNITGVLVCEESISKDIELFVKKFKYSKYYKFYLQGYSDIRLIVVDLSNKIAVANKKGESVKKVYSPAP